MSNVQLTFFYDHITHVNRLCVYGLVYIFGHNFFRTNLSFESSLFISCSLNEWMTTTTINNNNIGNFKHNWNKKDRRIRLSVPNFVIHFFVMSWILLLKTFEWKLNSSISIRCANLPILNYIRFGIDRQNNFIFINDQVKFNFYILKVCFDFFLIVTNVQMITTMN